MDHYKYQLDQVEKQFSETRVRSEALGRDDKRHRDEIRRQMIELDEMRSQVKLAQEKERSADANYKYMQKECQNTKELLEKEKRQTVKYLGEIDTLRKKNDEVASINERQNRYCEDMRKRYDDKKQELEQLKAANRDLHMQAERSTRETEQLKQKLVHSELRVRELVNEVRALEEKGKVLQSKCETLKFTSDQHERQKKEFINRLNNSTAVPVATAATAAAAAVSASASASSMAFDSNQSRFKANRMSILYSTLY